MEIKVLNMEELPDGGAKMEVEADLEFTQKAVEFYLLHLLHCALDPENKEYDIISQEDNVAKS